VRERRLQGHATDTSHQLGMGRWWKQAAGSLCGFLAHTASDAAVAAGLQPSVPCMTVGVISSLFSGHAVEKRWVTYKRAPDPTELPGMLLLSMCNVQETSSPRCIPSVCRSTEAKPWLVDRCKLTHPALQFPTWVDLFCCVGLLLSGVESVAGTFQSPPTDTRGQSTGSPYVHFNSAQEKGPGLI